MSPTCSISNCRSQILTDDIDHGRVGPRSVAISSRLGVNVEYFRIVWRRWPFSSGTRTHATTSSLPHPTRRIVLTAPPPWTPPVRFLVVPGGANRLTMLKGVLAANSSRCQEDPSVSLHHGFSGPRKAELRPGTYILVVAVA